MNFHPCRTLYLFTELQFTESHSHINIYFLQWPATSRTRKSFHLPFGAPTNLDRINWTQLARRANTDQCRPAADIEFNSMLNTSEKLKSISHENHFHHEEQHPRSSCIFHLILLQLQVHPYSFGTAARVTRKNPNSFILYPQSSILDQSRSVYSQNLLLSEGNGVGKS